MGNLTNPLWSGKGSLRHLVLLGAVAAAASSGCISEVESYYHEWEEHANDDERSHDHDDDSAGGGSSYAYASEHDEQTYVRPADWPDGYEEEHVYEGEIPCVMLASRYGAVCEAMGRDASPYHSANVSAGLTRGSVAIGEADEDGGWIPLHDARVCVEFLWPAEIEGTEYCDEEQQWFHFWDAELGATATGWDGLGFRVYADSGQLAMNVDYLVKLNLEYWGGPPEPVEAECECPEEEEEEDDDCPDD